MPGSGFIVVETIFFGLADSPDPIDIEYSCLIYPNGTGDRIYPFLVYNECINGFEFTLSDDYATTEHQFYIEALEAGLLAWSGYLDIVLRLEKNAEGDYVFASDGDIIGEPEKNYITMVDSPDEFFAAAGPKRITGGEGDDSDRIFPKGAGMSINDAWLYHAIPTGDQPAHTADLYRIILHEIGHILGLGHTNRLIWDESTQSWSNVYMFQPPKQSDGLKSKSPFTGKVVFMKRYMILKRTRTTQRMDK